MEPERLTLEGIFHFRMYDPIGDIHGHADALEQLLKTLGYARRQGVFRRPDRRWRASPKKSARRGQGWPGQQTTARKEGGPSKQASPGHGWPGLREMAGTGFEPATSRL